jgi:hypothetical protein
VSEFYPFGRGLRTGRFTDRSGQRHGRLVALRPLRKVGDQDIFWECRCDCGNAHIVRGASLGVSTKSCGCLKLEVASELLTRLGAPTRIKPRHGHAALNQTPTYHSWNSMKMRCVNRRSGGFTNYGARGISYDPRWESFDNFLADMGERPKGCQLNRIDNNGGYCKANCEWTTPLRNMNNRRNTHFVEYRGEKVALADLARSCGLKYITLRKRIEAGWGVDAAASLPLRGA